MTPYAIEQGCIKPEHVRLCMRVGSFVAMLPDGLTCHEVCERVVAAFGPSLRAVRGRFNYWDHSWLEIGDTTLVIDAYPWACGSGPILVDTRTGSPWATLYRAVSSSTFPQEK